MSCMVESFRFKLCVTLFVAPVPVAVFAVLQAGVVPGRGPPRQVHQPARRPLQNADGVRGTRPVHVSFLHNRTARWLSELYHLIPNTGGDKLTFVYFIDREYLLFYDRFVSYSDFDV